MLARRWPTSRAREHLADVKRVLWSGKDLPFPVLLDNTFETYQRWLRRRRFQHRADRPEGILVNGGLKDLELTVGRADKSAR